MSIKEFLTVVQEDQKQKALERSEELSKLAEKLRPNTLAAIQKYFPLFHASLQGELSNAPAAWLNMKLTPGAECELGHGHQSCGVVIEGLLISCREMSDGTTSFFISRFVSQDAPMDCLGCLTPLFQNSTLDAQLAKLLTEKEDIKNDH